jgi:hypothetical protein
MKSLLSVVLASALLVSTAPASYSEPRPEPSPEPRSVAPGTEVRLHIVGDIGTTTSRSGDPFIAVLSEPVFVGNTLLIPAGTRVHGTIGTVAPARLFSVFRGQAYMNLNFRSLEIDSRLIPVHMSILEILRTGNDRETPRRHDVKIDEGQIIEQRHDYRGDVLWGSVSSSGGALIGAIAGNVARGFGFGLIGSAAYIVARKGKEVKLPAGTGMLVNIDDAVTLPGVVTPTPTHAEAPAAQ